LFVHPAEADRVTLGFPEIVRYQIIVTRPGTHDEATVRLELRPGANAVEIAPQVGAAVQERLRLRLSVEVVPPGTIKEGAQRILDLRTWR
jgi:phenylacetate-coenzyme A ligase PaaK-like adenylate-forming protein